MFARVVLYVTNMSGNILATAERRDGTPRLGRCPDSLGPAALSASKGCSGPSRRGELMARSPLEKLTRIQPNGFQVIHELE
jgi:hypothetical protein